VKSNGPNIRPERPQGPLSDLERLLHALGFQTDLADRHRHRDGAKSAKHDRPPSRRAKTKRRHGSSAHRRHRQSHRDQANREERGDERQHAPVAHQPDGRHQEQRHSRQEPPAHDLVRNPAAAQSAYTPDGQIKIVVPRSAFGITPVDTLTSFLIRVSVRGGAVNLTPDNAPNSLAPTGQYVVKGNENCVVAQADLAVSSKDVALTGLKGSGNDQVLSVVVHNIGNATASNIKVRFSVDGTPVMADWNIGQITPGGTGRAWALWNTRGQNGTHTVTVTVDPAHVPLISSSFGPVCPGGQPFIYAYSSDSGFAGWSTYDWSVTNGTLDPASKNAPIPQIVA